MVEATVTQPPAPVMPAPKDATPPEYTTGKVKYDTSTGSVAVRTNIPDPDDLHDWGVMTVDRGGHYAGWDEVSSWIDLPTP